MNLRDLRGYIPMSILFASGPIYFFAFFLWRVIAVALRLSETAYQRGDDFIFSYYGHFFIFMYSVVTKTKVYLYGDLEDLRKRKESALCINNHQSAMDWILTVVLGYQQNSTAHMRFVMKGELCTLPYYGAALYYHGCIFVRRGDFHQELMLRSLARLNTIDIKTWMVIFAEGTRLTPEKAEQKEKSRQAAIKHDLPILEQVLTPHWKGSWLILSNMRESLDAVYSVTLAYSDTGLARNRRSAPGMTGAFKGLSSQMHIHVKRIPIAKVPKTEAKFGPWLHQEFVDKDKLMKSFYQHGSTKHWGPREPVTIPRLQVYVTGALFIILLAYLLTSPTARTVYIIAAFISGVASHLYMRLANVC